MEKRDLFERNCRLKPIKTPSEKDIGRFTIRLILLGLMFHMHRLIIVMPPKNYFTIWHCILVISIYIWSSFYCILFTRSETFQNPFMPCYVKVIVLFDKSFLNLGYSWGRYSFYTDYMHRISSIILGSD